LPKKKKYYAEIIYEEDIPEFLDAFRDTDIFVAVMLALTLGLRRGEVLGLCWEDVDYRNNTISINQTITHGKHGLTFTTPKTESSRRTILVSEKLIQLLKEHRKDQDEMREFFGRGYMENNLVNCRKDGSPITPSALSHKFSTRLETKGLKHIRFHDLRHTNATLMLKHNIPAKVASSRLGHSTIGITMDLYSHVLQSMESKVVEIFNNF
jgi:integrase